MDSFSAIEALKDYPVFTVADISRVINSTDSYTKTYANRISEKGRFKRVKRGVYTIHEDPLLVASYLFTPSYISLWSALRFYDVTEQLPNAIDVAVPRPARPPIEFCNTKINFFMTNQFFGYSKKAYAGMEIFVAEIEKVLIDCFITRRVPFNQAINAMKYEGFSHERLAEYALRTGKALLMRRMGYLIDSSGSGVDTTPLLRKTKSDYKYVPLDYLSTRAGKKNRKWHIIENGETDDIL